MKRKTKNLSKTTCVALTVVLYVIAALSLVAAVFYLSTTVGFFRATAYYSDPQSYRTVTLDVTKLWEYDGVMAISGTEEASDTVTYVWIGEENYDVLKESGVLDRLFVGAEITMTIADPWHPEIGATECAAFTYIGKTYLPYEVGSANLADECRATAVEATMKLAVSVVLLIPSFIAARKFHGLYRKKRQESAPEPYRKRFKE